VEPACPASALRLAPRVAVFLDRESAGHLTGGG
jgi:hypothetical protein